MLSFLQESCELFTSLYRTWSHSPIATIALCLLTGCYRHAGKQIIIYISRMLSDFIRHSHFFFTVYIYFSGDLVRVISDQEVTLEMLTELDSLVQLIESPIFTCT